MKAETGNFPSIPMTIGGVTAIMAFFAVLAGMIAPPRSSEGLARMQAEKQAEAQWQAKRDVDAKREKDITCSDYPVEWLGREREWTCSKAEHDQLSKNKLAEINATGRWPWQDAEDRKAQIQYRRTH
jgi:hypothetical protein